MKKNKLRKIKNSNIPQLKKDIKYFLMNEEGKVSKKNIAKIGITLAALGVALEPMNALAQHSSHNSHNNVFITGGNGGHSSTTVHSNSHSNHGSHSSGGWC
jgi:hypothetical protein